FKILEDGEQQDISVFGRESELPLNIVLAVDISLSTRLDIRQEMEAARQFVRTVVRPVDALSLYQFTGDVDEIVPFPSGLARIDRGTETIRKNARLDAGGTAVFDAIYLGAHALAPKHDRKVFVIVTDGEDTFSKLNYQDALRAAQEAEAILYSVIV